MNTLRAAITFKLSKVKIQNEAFNNQQLLMPHCEFRWFLEQKDFIYFHKVFNRMTRKNSRAARKRDKLRKQRERLQVTESFVYHQADDNWKNEQITKLHIPSPLHRTSNYNVSSMPLTDPIAVHQITPDGNCLFSALSYILTGLQKHHHHVRLAICDFMKSNTIDIEPLLPLGVNDIQSYLDNNQMEMTGTWGTELEIVAASMLLQSNIFVHSKSGTQWTWIKHSPPNMTVNHGIYLHHRDGNHFEVVVAVENSNIPTHLSSDQYYNPKVKQQSTAIKRKRVTERKRINKKYKSDKTFRISKMETIKKRYSQNKNFRTKKLESAKEKYRQDETFRSVMQQYKKQKYNLDQSYRYKKKMASITKYSTNALFRSNIRKLFKQKYSSDESFKQNKKETSKTRYSTDPSFKQKKKECSKTRYSTDPLYKQKIKASSIAKYSIDSLHRQKLKANSIARYSTDPLHRQKLKSNSIARYSTDPLHRQKLKANSIARYSTDPLHRQKLKSNSIARYSTDPLHRQKLKANSIARYSTDPLHRQKLKANSIARYSTDPLHRQKLKANSIARYSTDPLHRQKLKANSIARYSTDPLHRQKLKSRYSNDSTYRQRLKDISKTRYSTNTSHRQRVLEYSKSKYHRLSSFQSQVKASSIKKYASNPLFRLRLKNNLRETYHRSKSLQQLKKKRVNASRKSVSKSISTFKKSINDLPKYICRVCIRLLYRNQVKKYNEKRYFVKDSKHLNENAEKCFNATFSHICDDDICLQNCWMKILQNDKNWICHTCDKYLKQSGMPPQAQANNMFLIPVPTELSKLNVLERQMIALRIPFMKLLSLPRGGQKGVKGPVVNVPSDISNVTTSLPRNVNDAQLIKVKLKRKLEYKGHYTYQWISPTNVLEALQKLISSNLWYKNKEIDDSWIRDIEDSELVKNDSENSENNSDDESTEPITNNTSIPTKTSNNEEVTETSDNQSTLPVETCFQPIDIGQDVLDSNKTLCIAPAEGEKPQNIFQENGSDAMAFPTLLPDGHFGLHEDREIKLTPSKYFNARLFSADCRFSSNKEFIFFAQYVIEINAISSNISLALRKGKQNTHDDKPVTASMLIDSDNIQSILKSDTGYRFLQPVRGTPPYWQKTMKELYAMIQQLGIPTWFVTFSAAETRWNDVIETLLFLNNDDRSVEDIEWSGKCTLIADNPVICARMFDQRVKALFRDLLMAPSAPIGKITDYFYRTEFQNRGSPHIHCLFWIKDAPKFNENSDEEVCSFIDKYITCQMPDENTDPELYEIISSVQIHSKNHSKSCRKYSTTCRFNFPRPPIRKTFIATAESVDKPDNENPKVPTEKELDEISKNAAKSSKQKLKDIWILLSASEEHNLTFNEMLKLSNLTYKQFKQCLIDVAKTNTVYIKRQLSDIWVNNYNSYLSRAWNANLDIQFVTDAYACVAYILSYISKSETEMGDLLQNAQQEAEEGNVDAASAMRKIGNVYLHNREVSAQEAVYRVTGLHLKQCTRDVIFIPAGTNIVKMSLPVSLIRARCNQGGGDDENIWMTSIHDKYYARPDLLEFNDMCLAEFCSKFRILAKSQNQKSTEMSPVFQLKNELGSIKKRKLGKEAVIRYPKFNVEKNSEEYHLTLIQLFLPHRSKISLPSDTATFEAYVNNNQHILATIKKNKRNFESDIEQLEQAWEDLREGRISDQSWASLAPEADVERLEIEMENVPDNSDEVEQDEIPELNSENDRNAVKHSFNYEPPSTSHKVIMESLRSMNKTQQKVFYSVKEWCLKTLWKQNPEPFFIFLTGGAGTGKSHVIRCIYHEACRILSKFTASPDAISVLLTAPTGTAAFNIQGMTIHSAFSINKNVKLPYQPLGESLLNTLRSKLESLEILIIDEISMVDQKILTYVHGRLSQIKHCKKSFGNVAILAVGDFHQLPPVRGLALYKNRDSNFMDLWNTNFKKVTLTEIMRQKEDHTFAEMLNRIRTHKRGEALTDSDVTSLKSAATSEIQDNEQSMLHIFPTNKEVDNHNNTMINKLCNPVYSSVAKDYYMDVMTGKLTEKEQPLVNCAAEDLQTVIKIGVGARVMLTRNLDTDDGLVNGAFGTVTTIDLHSQQVTAIYVKFDNNKIGKKQIRKQNLNSTKANSIRIKPFQDTLVGKKVTRKQLPIKLAWAATIHKVQGMTVDKITVSLKKVFAPGMAYVALSRATTLSGLHIINFDPNSIYSSSDITEALENMPDYFQTTQSCTVQTSLNIIHHNTEGMIPHLADIKSIDQFREADIICFTETWLSKENTIPSSLFPCHQFCQLLRSESYSSTHPGVSTLAKMKNGGVAMFVRKHLCHDRLFFITNNVEAVGIICRDICILTVYRPPVYSYEQFIFNFSKLLTEIQSLKIPSLIIGDFNMNINELSSQKLIQKMNEFGYEQLIQEPTTEAGTCLDLVFVQGLINIPAVSVLPTYYSFHDALQIGVDKQ